MAAPSASLVKKLTKEIECSICLEIYTDPKTLPCLHTFCLRCLNGLAERRENHEPIACPDCRKEVALPEGGNFDDFPSAFHLRRLHDIVSGLNEGRQVRNLGDTADEAKLRLNEAIGEIRDEVRKLEEQLRENQEANEKLVEEITAAEVSVQRNTQRFIELAKRHETEVMAELALIRKIRQREFEDQTEKLERYLGQLKSVADDLDSVLTRGISGEILQAEPSVSTRFGELLKTVEELQPVRSERVKYVTSEYSYSRVEQLTLGWVSRRIIPRSYKQMRSFGAQGLRDGQFQFPVDIAVSSSGELAVADYHNHRVQVFSNEGRFLRKFGTRGLNDGQFQWPSGLAYDKTGNIVVCDRDNARMQVFSRKGRWMKKFGREVLKCPRGVSVTNENNSVVGDSKAKKVFVFSPEGKLLLHFAVVPDNETSTYCHAIFYDHKYFVSATRQVVRVFDARGAHLYDIGSEGHLDTPTGIAVDANDSMLLVCDSAKHCVRVFTLDGDLVNSFSVGPPVGGEVLCFVHGVTTGPEECVFVCDSNNHCIQIFTPQY